ncbi:cytochrome c biogenesis protein CcdA [Chamaesiphon sp. VAR_48_metabat_403]|uniref:cytochrome c biogenesis CcdA family protein n=1 Tax=Chamaesiphon sp. VAR_48_metabat_403 TaxID=2964700 RepID=UPI00286E5FC1|nr:cytochrome c biogenesis protein CcdA [Chamaesiphon sp. VAR_48_metabat_403]
MNVKNTLLHINKHRQRLPKWSKWVGLAIAIFLTILTVKYVDIAHLWQPLESLISNAENQYQKWGESQPLTNPWLLIPFAAGGGLLASISPCILAMLPVNLSYIGTLNVKSRTEAFWNATGFVLGVVTILSMLGLFSAVAGVVMVEWRGYINLAVGIVIVLMGLSIGGLFHLPLPQAQVSLPPFAGTYGVGVTFALISSPCASPVLFAVLAAAAATGSPVWSVLTMVAYALGYTAVIFATSLFAGLMRFTRQILVNSEAVMRWGGLALVLMGGYYVVSGVLWFL